MTFIRLNVKERIVFLPFAILVTQHKEKMTLRERFGTLCSRLGVKFYVPIVNLSQSSKVGRIAMANNATNANIATSALLPTTPTKPIFLTPILKSSN